jgi:hypothetical protein
MELGMADQVPVYVKRTQFQGAQNQSNVPSSATENLDFTVNSSYVVQFEQGQTNLGNIKSIIWNNSQNPNAVTVDVQGSNQTTTIPPYSTGSFPILANANATFTVSANGGTVNLSFNNFTVAASSISTNNSITPSGETIVIGPDNEGNLPSAAPVQIAGVSNTDRTVRQILTDQFGYLLVSLSPTDNSFSIDQTTPGSTNGVVVNQALPVGANVIGKVGIDPANNVVSESPYPNGATVVTSSSGNVANANAVASLGAQAGKTNWVTGFEISSAGATAGAIVVAALTGLLGGSFSYIYSVVIGASLKNDTLSIQFTKPIPASAANTAITLTLPALGTGNTNACVNLHGYYL